MSYAWILVADAARARIFSVDSPTAPLQPQEQLLSPEARLREQDLQSDRPGRSFDGVGAGRHTTDPSTSPKQQEAVRFAAEIMQHLERGRIDKAFDRLILVAEPHFLGLIRKTIEPGVEKMITLELDKDLSKLNRADIRGHLPERI